jgi:bacillithiol system protein YtxJ
MPGQSHKLPIPLNLANNSWLQFTSCMAWNTLTTPEQVEEIVHKSKERTQVIFKHSRRCNVSSMALSRLEKAGLPEHIDFHFLDLITHRPVSNQVADVFSVWHESPQVLVIRDGECVYDESHLGINMGEILEQSRGL